MLYCQSVCGVPGTCYDLVYWYYRMYPQIERRLSLGEYTEWLERMGRLTEPVRESLAFAEQKRRERPIICYVAGALTEASDADKERYEIVSEICEQTEHFFAYAPHVNGTDPVKHPNVEPFEVRDIDNLWARVLPQFHINFLSPLAHGNAIELAWAEGAAIATVGFLPEQTRLSRLTRGMINLHEIISYSSVGDMTSKLQDAFAAMEEWLDVHDFAMRFPGSEILGYFARLAFLQGKMPPNVYATAA